jgi:hypothetical protein
MTMIAGCGDDDGEAHDAGPDDVAGRGGAGGRSGAGAGGSTGGRGSSCPEPKHENLEEWCKDPTKECEHSFEARRALFCAALQCSRPSCGVQESSNTCGGRSVGNFRAYDLYSPRYSYDRDGKLVGVTTRPAQSSGCTASIVIYGMECNPLDGMPVDCANYEADGGVDDAGL